MIYHLLPLLMVLLLYSFNAIKKMEIHQSQKFAWNIGILLIRVSDYSKQQWITWIIFSLVFIVPLGMCNLFISRTFPFFCTLQYSKTCLFLCRATRAVNLWWYDLIAKLVSEQKRHVCKQQQRPTNEHLRWLSLSFCEEDKTGTWQIIGNRFLPRKRETTWLRKRPSLQLKNIFWRIQERMKKKGNTSFFSTFFEVKPILACNLMRVCVFQLFRQRRKIRFDRWDK